ncbi:rhotekin isoform X2 [Nematostella vectensis]|uniref:rhotekin isoform X2 n=1 Tax=Nematostella vectensis TaxID=45351 RepID=UPI0020771689|nr:rhotekin isoform X2 [Nematostella vectensis]
MESEEQTTKWDASALKQLDDHEIQKKIDYEVRMREGTVKLLAACHEEEQALEASKNLHTINARILALMSLLQRHRAKSVISRRRESSSSVEHEKRNGTIEPSKAKVSLSDIRIPLMWSPDDHTKAKAEQHVFYVFCLLKMDGQVLDTTMVPTDESETDIQFSDVIVFENVHSDFKLEIEIYYTISSESAANRNLGIKKSLRRTLSGAEGLKFVLAGHTQLTVDHLDDKIKTYDLKTGLVGASATASTVSTEETHSPELALWGQICCRLAAQPDCFGHERVKGYLNVQCISNGQNSWTRLWCVLKHASLSCWEKEEDSYQAPPKDIIDIKVHMEVKDSVSPLLKQQNILILTSPTHEKEPVLSAESDEEFVVWREALKQAVCDVNAWKKGCRTEMKVECPSTRKLPPAPKKLYDSIEVLLSPLDESDENIPLPPRPELADVNSDSASTIKCTYDVWQRRKPERSSLREKKTQQDNSESSI